MRGTGFMRGFFGSGPIFRFTPGVSLQYQFQGLAPSRQIQITLAGPPLTATDNTTLQTNLNDMSGAPVVLVSGGTLPASGIVVSPIPISGTSGLVRELPPLSGLLRSISS